MLLLQIGAIFGQVNRQPPPPAQPDPGQTVAMCACYGVLFAAGLIVQILFLLTLSRCLAQCAPRNRTMEPGMVWLNLIPLFNIVWMFITIIRLSESLRAEFRYRRMHSDDPDFAQMTGILYMILSFFCGIVALVFFIMYWVKIAGYKNQLESGGRGYAYDDLEDDYDDRPRRPSRRRDEDDYDHDKFDRRHQDDY